MKARYSGICPCCPQYVRAGRSQIEALPIPLTPTAANHVVLDAESHYGPHWIEGPSGRPTHCEPRPWAHERCARKFQQRYDDDPEACLAEERERHSSAEKQMADARARRKSLAGGAGR